MSSLKDLASLIMIPSLVKDGRLDTVKPLGNSIIHPDATGNNDGTDGSTPAEGNFTFSRGSNLAATRVDVNGLIEKGRENLLVQSNQFDTTWANINSTETSGQSGYDGSNNAWKIDVTTATNSGLFQAVSASGVYTYSIYAKAGNINFLGFTSFAGTSYDIFFNLSNGTIASQTGLIDATITSAGNGFYRCTLTSINPVYFQIKPSSQAANPSLSAGYIYIQDAQVESGLVATPYIETGASTAQAGILEDLPRLDYSGGASCPSLLLEPQRTNSVINSEKFDASEYNYVSGITRTANAAVSPEGLENAYLITEDSSNATHRIGQSSWSQSVADTSVSVFAKANGRRYIVLGNANMGPSMNTYFDLENGVVGIESAAIIDASIEPFGDGWYRCSISYLPNKGNTYPTIYLSPNNGGSVSYQGDGVSGVYLYGYQIEVNASYPTSYIPTYGSAVTRSGDSTADLDTSSLLTQSNNNTYFAEVVNHRNTGNTRFITSYDSARNNGDRILIYSGNASTYYTLHCQYKVSGETSIQFNIATNVNYGDTIKFAVVFNGTEMIGFANGVKTATATIVDADNFNKFDITDTANELGVFKQLLAFPTALTDSECIALTTL